MELKASFGKYKAKEVDAYIAQLKLNHIEEKKQLSNEIALLKEELKNLQDQNAEHTANNTT